MVDLEVTVDCFDNVFRELSKYLRKRENVRRKMKSWNDELSENRK